MYVHDPCLILKKHKNFDGFYIVIFGGIMCRHVISRVDQVIVT